MKITITFRHMAGSDALKEYATEKLGKLEKYADRSTEAHLVMAVEKHLHCAELVVKAKRLHAQGTVETNDMYVSIDAAVDKVEKTLRRNHEKKLERKRGGSRTEAAA